MLSKIFPKTTFYFLLLFPPAAFSQADRLIDSLKHAIAMAPVDSNKAVTMHYLFNKLAQAGEMKEAKAIADSSLALSERLHFKRGMRFSLNNIGTWYYHMGNFNEAIRYYKQAYDVAKSTNGFMGMEGSLNNIGVMYMQQGIYDKAMENFTEAATIEEVHNLKPDYANTLANMAQIDMREKEYKKALELLKKAAGAHIGLKDTSALAVDTKSIGLCYLDLKAYPEAMKELKEGLLLAERANYKQLQCDLLIDIGMVNDADSNYSEAIKNYKDAFTIAQRIESDASEIASLQSLGGDETDLKQYDSATFHLNKALALSNADSADEYIASCNNLLAAVASKTGRFEAAYNYLQNYNSLHDSIFNREKLKAINEAQAKYESSEKDRRIDSLNYSAAIQSKQIETSHLWTTILVIGIASLMLLSILSFFVFRHRNRVKSLEEMLALRNKISSNLHDDIGSALSSISIFSDVVSKKGVKSVPEDTEILHKISSTANEAMQNMSDIVWSINPENDSFADIISRMQYFASQILEAKKITLYFNVAKNLESQNLTPGIRHDFYLIFKEAVNNIAKYSEAQNAYIKITKEGRELQMDVRDDGKGFDKEKIMWGNGLKSMKKRAESLKGKWEIFSSPGSGTHTTLSIPLP